MTTTTFPSSRASTRPFTTTPGDHRFFSTMSIVTALTIMAGFASTYLPKVVAGAPPVPPIVHVHALIFVSWLVLFVFQTTLVASGRTALHRRLGIAGMLLAGLMFVVGSAVHS